MGRLLADPRGPRVAVLEATGWDTHQAQGLASGQLALALKGLGQSLAKLKQALGPAWQRTTVIAITEFGRTVAVNGTGGTDHGTGTVALLLGGRVAGGRVIADWPGLAREEALPGPRPRPYVRSARRAEGDLPAPARDRRNDGGGSPLPR